MKLITALTMMTSTAITAIALAVGLMLSSGWIPVKSVPSENLRNNQPITIKVTGNVTSSSITSSLFIEAVSCFEDWFERVAGL